MSLGALFKATSVWNPILEKMKRRFSGWKRLYLSKGGRLTLLKSMLSSLPTYYLSFFSIPRFVVDRLERIHRNFLWGSTDAEFKCPLVAWVKVCSPVEVGGLGIKKIGSFNQAPLGKCLRRFRHETTHLWCQVVASKYGEEWGGRCTKASQGLHGCCLWRRIKMGW